MSTRAEPTGKERMKRRTPSDLNLMPRRYERDPKKAYSKKQLAEIGAISILWNQIEAHIDFIGSHVLYGGLPFHLILATDRKIGMTGKIDLLRVCSEKAKWLDDEAKVCIKLALDGVVDYRKLRNAIVHHHIYDHKKGIASFLDESGKSHQVVITYEALAALYMRLEILRDELIKMDILFRLEMAPEKIRIFDPKTGALDSDQPKALRERVIPGATEEVQVHQRKRLALPPLPLFPDARRVAPAKAKPKRPRGKA